MYEPLLFLHSWNRWIVFLAVIYFWLRSLLGWWRQARWAPADTYFLWVFNQIFGYQVMFGIALWVGMSPLTKAVLRTPSLLFDGSVLFFWALRHPLTMILALGVFHLGKARSKNLSPPERFGVFAVTFSLVLLMISSAIPWPGLFYGRDLFRWAF